MVSIPEANRNEILGLVTIVSLDTEALKKISGLKTTATEMKATERAASAAREVQLSKKITAQAISTGHAFSKHATEFAELGVKTNAELQTLIENTISRPSLSGTLQNWRSFYFNSKSRVVVIVNPAAIDKGTVFVIDKMKYPDPMSYIKRLR